MVLADPFTSSRFVQTASRIFSRSFDLHRVDVLQPVTLQAHTPVLVMHDGMNVFFEKYSSTGHTWQVLEALETGRILADPLVIAVWGEGGTKKFNSRRINEFLCDDIFAEQPELWETLNPVLTPPTAEPRGNYLMDLIADEVLPTVLSEFNVNHAASRTAIAGCSVAGVASIYSLTRRPEIFGAGLAYSAHWEFGGSRLIDALTKRIGSPEGRLIWSDIGSLGLDADSVELNTYFGHQLESYGWRNSIDYVTSIFWGTGHSEIFWARRFEYPINFWLQHINASEL